MHSFLQKIQVNEFFSDQQLYMSLFSDLNTGDLCIQQMISLISGLLEKNLQAITCKNFTLHLKFQIYEQLVAHCNPL